MKREDQTEYEFINKWMQHEPNIDLIVPYVQEVKSKMSNREVNKLRERFLYKKKHGHEAYLKWYFIDAAKEMGFDAKEIG